MTFDLAPKSWRKVSLSDCCKIISGATPRRDNPEYWGGTIPWVTPKDLSKLEGSTIEEAPEYITEKGYRSCSTDLLPKGAVLFSSRAPIGHVAIAGRPMCTNQGFKSLIPGDELTSSYLYWCLRKLVPEISARGTGTTFKEVSKAVMEEFEIPLPPLPEQKRIAAILDKADSIRRKRQEAVLLTEELLRSVFLDMFGDPVTNPKGIKNVCLSEVTTRITDGTHLTPTFIDSGVPFIFVKNIKNGKIDFQTDKYISEVEHKKLYERCPVEEGDILYTTVGATYGQAVAVGSFTKFAFQRHVAHVKPDKSKVLSDYLGTIMQLPIVKNQADRWARGAAQPTVNLTELRDFVIPLPPLHLQREFGQKVASVEKLKYACRLPLEHAETLFNSLLQRAFKGVLLK